MSNSEYVVNTRENPMPGGGRVRFINADDGARLRVIEWRPADVRLNPCRGTVFLFGGRTEFAEKYFETVHELLMRGFAVATMDWRGQGLSAREKPDPRRGHIDDFVTFDHDLAAFMHAVAPAFPKPWVAMAHSMGGNILLRAVHDNPSWFSALVATAPMLGINIGLATRLFAYPLAYIAFAIGLDRHYIPGGGPAAADEEPFDGNPLTGDPARYALHQMLVRTDPRLGLGSPTFGWLKAAMQSIAVLAKPSYLSSVSLPVLLAMAQREAIVDNAAIRHAAKILPNAQLVAIEEAHHEILMEQDYCRQQFWGYFDAFMAQAI
ncbi:MAG: alpha/beta hydrolase [Parvibaculaceae bacterium]|nr:alpha/beta hydrolase [Parvibaculaceae bacterium]